MTAKQVTARVRRRAHQVLAPIGMWEQAQRIIDWAGVARRLVATLPGAAEDYEVDHVLPLSRFDLRDAAQVKQAFAASNHAWLRVGANRSKGARVYA